MRSQGENVSIWIKMVDQIHALIPQRHGPWGWIWVREQEASWKVKERTWKHRD